MATTFAKRVKARLERQREYNKRFQEQVVLDAEAIMRAYDDAYFALHKKNPNLSYHRGWYSVNGNNVRRSELVRMTGILQARLHEKELNNEKDV